MNIFFGYLSLIFFATLTVGYLLFPFIIRFALRNGITDMPDGNLKKHEKETAYLGGVGVAVTMVAGLVLCGLYTSFEGFFLKNHIFAALTCLCLLLLGLVDDLRDLSPLVRIIGHGAAAALFVQSGAVITVWFLPSWMNVAGSVLFHTALINACNLVDIMDGLCAVIALAIAVCLVLWAFACKAMGWCALLVIFIASVSAFLLYNRPPAQIYLGDCGALCIGGFLSYAAVQLSLCSATPISFLLPFFVLLPLVFEVTSLVLIRTYKGIPFYKGSRHHFAHFFLDRGWKKEEILVFSLFVVFSSYFFFVLIKSFCF